MNDEKHVDVNWNAKKKPTSAFAGAESIFDIVKGDPTIGGIPQKDYSVPPKFKGEIVCGAADKLPKKEEFIPTPSKHACVIRDMTIGKQYDIEKRFYAGDSIPYYQITDDKGHTQLLSCEYFMVRTESPNVAKFQNIQSKSKTAPAGYEHCKDMLGSLDKIVGAVKKKDKGDCSSVDKCDDNCEKKCEKKLTGCDPIMQQHYFGLLIFYDQNPDSCGEVHKNVIERLPPGIGCLFLRSKDEYTRVEYIPLH